MTFYEILFLDETNVKFRVNVNVAMLKVFFFFFFVSFGVESSDEDDSEVVS